MGLGELLALVAFGAQQPFEVRAYWMNWACVGA